MSTAAHPVVPEGAPRGALVARLISAFSGTVGVGAKIAFLAASNGVAIWAIYVLMTRHHWVAGRWVTRCSSCSRSPSVRS